MKIDILNIVYTTFMIILAFVSALIVTQTISKYTQKQTKEKKDEL